MLRNAIQFPAELGENSAVLMSLNKSHSLTNDLLTTCCEEDCHRVGEVKMRIMSRYNIYSLIKKIIFIAIYMTITINIRLTLVSIC